jgi:hypothetical protein
MIKSQLLAYYFKGKDKYIFGQWSGVLTNRLHGFKK